MRGGVRRFGRRSDDGVDGATAGQLRGFAAEKPLGELDALAGVLELELDPVTRRARAYAHLATERRGERVLGRTEGILQIGVDYDRLRVAAAALPVLDLSRPPLRL